MFHSTADSRSLPRKPRPWRKSLSSHSAKPHLPQKHASFWPAGAEARHEEGEKGGGSGIYAGHAITLGLAQAEPFAPRIANSNGSQHPPSLQLPLYQVTTRDLRGRLFKASICSVLLIFTAITCLLHSRASSSPCPPEDACAWSTWRQRWAGASSKKTASATRLRFPRSKQA